MNNDVTTTTESNTATGTGTGTGTPVSPSIAPLSASAPTPTPLPLASPPTAASMVKNYNTFCNNCGKNGHLYNTCKSPITSIGVIAFRDGHSGIEFLMIRRKDSFGYVDFIRGKYPISNECYIQTMIDEMTLEEKHRILHEPFENMWKGMWGIYSGIQYRGEETVSHDKYRLLKHGIKFGDKEYTLRDFVARSATLWTEPEWGFPKGRRNYQEKDIICALRECLEETGYDIRVENVISNIMPYEEIFMGSNMKCYKQKYFLAYMDSSQSQIRSHDVSEVSDIKWCTYDECVTLIRSHNLEKLKILQRIHGVLQKYRLYS